MRLLAVFAAISFAALAISQESVDQSAIVQEMNALTAPEWRPGVPFGQKLASLPGSMGYQILRDNWTKGASIEARKQMFKGFVFQDHPDTLKVLHLGATDPNVEMQNWTFTYLKNIAFMDFSEDYSAYAPWAAKYIDRPLKEVVAENFDRLMKEAASSTGEARERYYRRLSLLRSGSKLHSPLALQMAKEIFAMPSPSREAMRAAERLLSMGQADDDFLKEIALPAIDAKNLDLRHVAVRAIAPVKAEWAEKALVEMLTKALSGPGKLTDGFLLGHAFAARKDPKHIPLLIGAIVANNSYETIYGIGYFGLREITGVSYDKTHDGAWWKDWWEENKARFPADVQGRPIPVFKKGG